MNKLKSIFLSAIFMVSAGSQAWTDFSPNEPEVIVTRQQVGLSCQCSGEIHYSSTQQNQKMG